MMMMIIIIIIPITIIYTTFFQMIFFFSDIALKLHMDFLPLHCYMSRSSHPSFGYINNIYKIKVRVSEMGGNQDTYESNSILAQACYGPRGFQVFKGPKV